MLAFGAQADAVQAFRAAAAALALPLTVVEDTAPGEASRYAASLVLVRPDQFVAWSTKSGSMSLDEARAVLERSWRHP